MSSARRHHPLIEGAVAVAVVAVVGVLLWLWPVHPSDYTVVWLPAARLWLLGANPYDVPTFLSPPWALAVFAPFAWLPEHLAVFLLRAAMLAAFVAACWKLRLTPLGFLAVIASKTVLNSVLLGNVEGLVVLGGFAPAGVAVLAFSLKPQVGALLLAARARPWWEGGRRVDVGFVAGVVVVAAAALAGAPHAWWQGSGRAFALPWNVALWPWGVPLGVVALVLAWRRGSLPWALLAGPLLSPYLSPSAWSGAMVGLAKLAPWWVAAGVCALTWVFL